MLLKNKHHDARGNLIAQFIVLLIVAVILIILITSFGAKIWASFFGSEDKSTLQSFETAYTLLKTKSISKSNYDSTTLNIYLKDDYKMVFYDTTEYLDCGKQTYTFSIPSTVGTSSSTTTQDVKYYKPTACENYQCFCLYKKKPAFLEKDKDKNIVKCYPIKDNIPIDNAYLDINTVACSSSKTLYRTLYFIKYNKIDDQLRTVTPYVYVLENIEARRKTIDDLSVIKCSNVNDNAAKWCFGLPDGTVVQAHNAAEITQIEDFCKVANPAFKSTSIICEFNKDSQDNNNCIASCDLGNEISKCGNTYKSCTDFNTISGVRGVKFISTEYDYKSYYMCNNNANYCKFTQDCQSDLISVRAYIKSSDGAAEPYTKSSAPELQDCNTKYITQLQSSLGNFVTTYDASDACDTYFNNNFYPSQYIKSCKPDKLSECEKFVNDNKKICALKYIQDGNNYWLTYYDTTKTECDIEKINAIFMSISFCAAKT